MSAHELLVSPTVGAYYDALCEIYKYVKLNWRFIMKVTNGSNGTVTLGVIVKTNGKIIINPVVPMNISGGETRNGKEINGIVFRRDRSLTLEPEGAEVDIFNAYAAVLERHLEESRKKRNGQATQPVQPVSDQF